MTKYTIIVEGDQNDADYVSESFDIDLSEQVCSGWEGYEHILFTYMDLFKAFGKALTDLKKEYINVRNSYNWCDDNEYSYKDIVLQRTFELLGSPQPLNAFSLEEILWDFIPGTCDYPIHTILSITALPTEGSITFF